MYTNDYSNDTAPEAQPSREWMKRQLSEAIAAGEQAVSSLTAARDRLSSARNWGIFDMLGGGFLASMIKHSKMESAAQDLERARADLEYFQDELQDIHILRDFNVDVGGFLSFADVFMDSFVADALVQEKIGRARRQTDEAIEEIRSILGALREKLRTL